MANICYTDITTSSSVLFDKDIPVLHWLICTTNCPFNWEPTDARDQSTKTFPLGGGGGLHLLWQCIWQRCGNKLYFCGGPFSPHAVNLKEDRKKTKKGGTISEEMMSYLISSNRTSLTANLF
jgi:hypothetical protein